MSQPLFLNFKKLKLSIANLNRYNKYQIEFSERRGAFWPLDLIFTLF